MDEEFKEWWMNGGSEAWSKALDDEGGILKALEMVFASGGTAAIKKSIRERDAYEKTIEYR